MEIKVIVQEGSKGRMYQLDESALTEEARKALEVKIKEHFGGVEEE